MKETERIVRAYEEAIKEMLDAMAAGLVGKEPDKQTRARRKRTASKLDRIRKSYRSSKPSKRTGTIVRR